MQLNHLNLCVGDLAEARDFFERLLEFQFVEQKGDALAVLTDRAGVTLVLSDVRAFGGETPVRYPKGFHVGFLVPTPEEVDRAYQRLTAASLPIERTPRNLRGGYSFYRDC